jgi:hypothetical protein
MNAKSVSGSQIVGDEAELRLNVGDAPAFEIFGNHETEQSAADGVIARSATLRLGHGG